MPCHFCGVVNTICFWGPRPVKSWKRPVPPVISVPMLAGGFVFTWAMLQKESILGVALGALLLAMGAFGIVIALLGCDNCVARAFGEF